MACFPENCNMHSSQQGRQQDNSLHLPTHRYLCFCNVKTHADGACDTRMDTQHQKIQDLMSSSNPCTPSSLARTSNRVCVNLHKLFSIPRCLPRDVYFNADTSSLHCKSKLRNACLSSNDPCGLFCTWIGKLFKTQKHHFHKRNISRTA